MTGHAIRFDAAEFSGITNDMHRAYGTNGVILLEGLISHDDCDALIRRVNVLIEGFDASHIPKTFSTTVKAQDQEEYFLSSGDKIRFFMEEDAIDSSGTLITDKHLGMNKVGHALHDLDPVFDRISRQHRIRDVATGLGLNDPLLVQSMSILKPPHIGGEVVCHQDSTYLWTEPQTVIGLWIALEDATIENGCLWGIPGPKTDQPKCRMRRNSDGTGTEVIILDDTPFDESARVPLEAPKGTLIAFSGTFPHLSGRNQSAKSRHAYSLHVIEAGAHYPDDNWLRRPSDFPLRGF